MQMPPSSEPVKQFRFAAYWVDKILFSSFDPAKIEPVGQPGLQRVDLQAGMGVDEENLRGQVSLTVIVTPDPRIHPYKIEVMVTGQFAAAHGASPEDLDLFCRVNAPAILFPFARQVIHGVTMDGRQGPVLLQPMNMLEALKPDGWNQSDAQGKSAEAKPEG